MTPQEWQRSPERKCLNVRLLRRIERHILEEPKRMSMKFWRITDPDIIKIQNLAVPPCGTVACVRGWADEISGGFHGDALGLSDDQKVLLFYTEEWPDHFNQRIYRLKPQTFRYARCVVDRIEHLIRTGE